MWEGQPKPLDQTRAGQASSNSGGSVPVLLPGYPLGARHFGPAGVPGLPTAPSSGDGAIGILPVAAKRLGVVDGLLPQSPVLVLLIPVFLVQGLVL